jgi:23S rRNA pseudouridine1911/1915/1917 synthase
MHARDLLPYGKMRPRTIPRNADFVVPAAIGPQRIPLDRALRAELGASWESVRRLVRTGKIRVEGRLVTDPTTLVDVGARVCVRMASPRPVESSGIRKSDLVHVDAQVVVVRKTAGISTVRHPSESDPSAPLDEVVRALLRKTSRKGGVAPLGIVQRLDRETSGLIVFSRTMAARDALRQQFRNHSVHRRYVALVHGRLSPCTFTSRLVEDRGDGIRGSTTNPKLGREAVTHVGVLENLPEATLVQCRLETGRTHQIRIHLSESGHPLVGERVYIRDYRKPLIEAPRLMLHAAELGFLHPKDGREMRFSEPMPRDMAEVVERLGGSRTVTPSDDRRRGK